MSIAVAEKKFIDWELLAKSWIHSRKCMLYVIVLLLGSIFLFVKLLDGGQWVDLVKWATGGYMAGNGISSIGAALAKNGNGNGQSA
jgi:hypothetical protein